MGFFAWVKAYFWPGRKTLGTFGRTLEIVSVSNMVLVRSPKKYGISSPGDVVPVSPYVVGLLMDPSHYGEGSWSDREAEPRLMVQCQDRASWKTLFQSMAQEADLRDPALSMTYRMADICQDDTVEDAVWEDLCRQWPSAVKDITFQQSFMELLLSFTSEEEV